MTTNTNIVNRALQGIGTRTTVTDAELAGNLSNEAIQANLVLTNIRDDLIRMAPWDCATTYANLTLITSVPGTPENSSPATTTWQKGQPAPPWAYEYQYPVDCLRALWIIPQFQPGFTGVPITTAVTGFAPYWRGPAIKFKISLDQFWSVIAAAVASSGTGYGIGQPLTLAATIPGSAPIGAPAQLIVSSVDGSGVILTVFVVNQILGSTVAHGGSYFNRPANPVAHQAIVGLPGATFNLTFDAFGDQRVILTNQEFAILAYCKQVTDPNVMDTLFQSAWIDLLSASLVYALTGDKTLANLKIAEANNSIMEARKADGNEGLTIIDSTPDWIRARGICYPNDYGYGGGGFDWGPLWPSL